MAPRTVLPLSSGNLALRNVKFLVADNDVSFENLLFALSVLHHLQVDTGIVLVNNPDRIQEMDCTLAELSETEATGCVGRPMFRRKDYVQDVELHRLQIN